jgi:magnesium transporter
MPAVKQQVPPTTLAASRRIAVMGDTLRRLARRGARNRVANLLSKTRPEDVAGVLPTLTPEERSWVFELMVQDFAESAGQVLTEVEPSLRLALLEGLTAEEVAHLLRSIPVDDAVFVVESLPEGLRDQVLEIVDLSEGLDEIQTHLTYGDESAGRIMDTQYFALSEERTVREAVEALRGAGDVENIFYVYVVDDTGHLVGVASLRQLLLADPERSVADVMTRSVIKAHTDTDQEEVAALATRYNLLAIPVTDDANRLVGIVTVDDIIDVVQEEATEDFLKMVGTSEDELIYQDRPFRVAGIRLPWLLVNLVGGLAAGLLLRQFQLSIGEALLLSTFVPVIMGMGGNIGSQTSTIAVRGLATGHISVERRKVARFVWQQMKVGTLLGLACALLVGLVALFIETSPYYGLVVGVSMWAAMLLASASGSLIPVLFERLGIDPAVAAGPLVTTSNDITGILIYCSLAMLLLDLLVR